jgi:hypothetical protein
VTLVEQAFSLLGILRKKDASPQKLMRSVAITSHFSNEINMIAR